MLNGIPLKIRPPLAEELRFPDDKGPCAIRIIQVPPEIHSQYKHASDLPLYQMIGKNVGIKRALGEFVLATNIDIFFPDSLICFMRDKLEKGVLYRSDRLDIPNELPLTESFDDLLAFCQDEHFRINGKFGTQNLNPPPFFFKSALKAFFTKTAASIKSKSKKITSSKAWKALFLAWREMFINRFHLFFYPQLHLNGCGDFTLLSNDDWQKLRGYPEWDMFSFHIDSVLLFQAYYHGIREIDLPREMSIYHIEHGSGYSAEAAKSLFQRLDEKGIAYLKYLDFLRVIRKLRLSKTPIVYNDEHWGLSQFELEESEIGSQCV